MLFIYSYNFNAVCNQLKLVSFKEEQRPDRIDAASHEGAAVLAHGHVASSMQQSIWRCFYMKEALIQHYIKKIYISIDFANPREADL